MTMRPVSTFDFMAYQYLSDPQLSPDSSAVLFVNRSIGPQNSYDTCIWIASLMDGAARPFTAGYNDTRPRWSPDGQRIAFVRSSQRGNGQLYVMDSQGGEAMPLALFPEGRIGEIRWSPNGQWLAVTYRQTEEERTSNAALRRRDLGLSDPPFVIDTLCYRYDPEGYFNAERYALYLVDAQSGRAFQVFNQDALGSFSFDFSPDSARLVIAANRSATALLEPWKDELLILEIASRRVQPLEGAPECKKFRVRWSPDGSKLAFGGFLGHERSYCPTNVELFVCDAQTGETSSVTAQHDLCFQGNLLSDRPDVISNDPNYLWMPDSRRLIASVTRQGSRHLVTIDVMNKTLKFETSGPFHDELGSISADGSKVAFCRSSATRLPEVYVGRLEAAEMALQQISHQNDECFAELMTVQPEEHWITSADGAKVQLWVMKPLAESAEQQTAAILDIHGGPFACFGNSYRHAAQVLAAQGYTVVYPNIRGSKGYGKAFSAPLKDAWGMKDWEDIQAVIAFMQHLPGVDKNRLGVLGASYGGYMANWITGHTNAFKVAISDRALCNLVSFFGTTDLVRPFELSWGAAPWHNVERLWEQSPLKYVGDVTTPTLILHGEGDLRVSIEQAEQWFTSLRLRNVPARFVRYPGSATHQMARSGPADLRLHRLEQILMWLSAYLD